MSQREAIKCAAFWLALTVGVGASVCVDAFVTATTATQVAEQRTTHASTIGAPLPETPRLRLFGIAEGLPSSNVNAIAQGPQGYLWIATDDGLARFDGVGFKVWQHAPDDAGSLPGNLVQALHVDASGRVWVALEGQGLAMLLPDGVHFRQYRHVNTAAMGEEDVFAIASTIDARSKETALWFGTFGGGLYRIDAGDAFTHLMPVEGDLTSLPDANVLALADDHHGGLWVATTSGLAHWNGRVFERVDAAGVAGAVVFNVFVDASDQVWIATKAGLYLRAVDGRVRQLPWGSDPSTLRVTNVLRDRSGEVWLGAPQLLHACQDDGSALAAVSGFDERILGIIEDREGSLWFATHGKGLAQLAPGWRQFATFAHDQYAPDSLSTLTPQALGIAGDGRIWIAGPDGRGQLDRIDPVTGAVEHWVPAQLAGKVVWSFNQQADALWVGMNSGLARVDLRSKAVTVWEAGAGKDAALDGPLDLMTHTPDGHLWISAQGGGIQSRDLQGHVLVNIVPDDGKGLIAGDSEQLGVSPQGQLWIAGAQGLLQFNPSTQHVDAVPGAPVDRVYGFAFADASTLWLHRLGALERYRWDGHALSLQQRIGAAEELPAAEAGGVIVDARGTVWVTTLRGLLHYDPALPRLTNYGVRDGLVSQEFANHPPLLTPSGLIAAGTVDGLVLFDPLHMAMPVRDGVLTVSTVTLRRGDRQIKVDWKKPITLQAGDRDLDVNMRLLSFANPQAHRYRSQLVGFEDGWIAQGNDGERVFSQLEPGSYRLLLQAATGDAAAWGPSMSLQVEVQPPWWRTPLAYALYALAALLLIALAALSYRARLRRRHAQALSDQRHVLTEQASEAKTRFLATMGHEIRTPMTGVLGMTELLLGTSLDARQRSQAESIQHAGQHLLRLVNDALDLARIEAGKLAFDDVPFDLRALVREVDELLRPLAQAKGLAFATHVSDDAPRGLRGDCARVRQILLNLGTNAIKFTEHGNVRIHVMRDAMAHAINPQAPSRTRFEVSDTGAGLNSEQQSRLFQRFEQADGARTAARYGGSGLGLAICQELTAAMDGEIKVDSTPGIGTTFAVSLPLPEVEPPTARMQALHAATPMGANAPRAIDGVRPTDPESSVDVNEAIDAADRDERQDHAADRSSEERDSANRSSSNPSLSLLLVEDDPTIAEVLCGLLEAQGHRITHAAHGLAALTELDHARFDAALLDLDLPGVNGLDLARLIRARDNPIPLLAVTARADAAAEPNAMAAGMNGFLRKPVTGQMLAESLERLLSR